MKQNKIYVVLQEFGFKSKFDNIYENDFIEIQITSEYLVVIELASKKVHKVFRLKDLLKDENQSVLREFLRQNLRICQEKRNQFDIEVFLEVAKPFRVEEYYEIRIIDYRIYLVETVDFNLEGPFPIPSSFEEALESEWIVLYKQDLRELRAEYDLRRLARSFPSGTPNSLNPDAPF